MLPCHDVLNVKNMKTLVFLAHATIFAPITRSFTNELPNSGIDHEVATFASENRGRYGVGLQQEAEAMFERLLAERHAKEAERQQYAQQYARERAAAEEQLQAERKREEVARREPMLLALGLTESQWQELNEAKQKRLVTEHRQHEENALRAEYQRLADEEEQRQISTRADDCRVRTLYRMTAERESLRSSAKVRSAWGWGPTRN